MRLSVVYMCRAACVWLSASSTFDKLKLSLICFYDSFYIRCLVKLHFTPVISVQYPIFLYLVSQRGFLASDGAFATSRVKTGAAKHHFVHNRT